MFSLIAPSKAHSQQSHCLSTVHKNQSLLSLPPSHPIIINWGNKKHQTEALLLKHSQNNECFFYIIYIELESLLKINNVFRSGQIGRGTRFQLPLSVSVNTHEMKRTGPGLFFAWTGVKIYMRGKKSSDVPQKTRISITQWLLLHVTWPLSLLYQLESQYASAHIFLAGVVTDPSPLRDEYLISMLRKIGVWWHRHGCAALVLLWVTWILENVSICEENPVGWI